MATIYYLNWDKPDNKEQQDFFHNAHLSETDISSVHKDWYRKIAEVNSIEREKIWTAFQGGVPVDSTQDDLVELKEVFQNAEERSMSVGDVVELGGEPHIAVSIGFKKTEWV